MHSSVGYPSVNTKTEITSTERILLYINMHILKLSIGNAVWQQRHMSYRSVSAGLIHTMQFHVLRTVATDLNQGLGNGFNLKLRVIMKIMNLFYPPSNKMMHIVVCMSVGWSVYLYSRFPTIWETYNVDRLTPQTSTILTVLKIFIVLQTRDGGGGGQDHYRLCCGGGLKFTFTKTSIVIFV